MKYSDLKLDCKYFRGDIPCKPHKLYNTHCLEDDNICEYYEKSSENILIIKLGAIGDVIRTTPLFSRLKSNYPNAKFYWLTYTPDVVPENVDEILDYNFKSVEYLKSIQFDIAINLDKDKDACALLENIISKKKYGYILKNGLIAPADKNAEHKLLTGIFDDLNIENNKNYLEEIFEICGYNYSGEKYILKPFDEFSLSWNFDKSKKIIGLNTGCGGRWSSRLWPEKYWIEISRMLIDAGYQVLFLGGKLEHEKNKRIASIVNGIYLGHFPLKKFINLVHQTDLVVTSVTMAMHIALALNKKIVLFNNIFNKSEFELFGLGKIIEPSKKCKCFFSPKCTNNDYQCMDYLEPITVYNTIIEILNK